MYYSSTMRYHDYTHTQAHIIYFIFIPFYIKNSYIVCLYFVCLCICSVWKIEIGHVHYIICSWRRGIISVGSTRHLFQDWRPVAPLHSRGQMAKKIKYKKYYQKYRGIISMARGWRSIGARVPRLSTARMRGTANKWLIPGWPETAGKQQKDGRGRLMTLRDDAHRRRRQYTHT